MAAVGSFILSFSLALANTGFFTFYQHNIPTDVMRRIGSMIGLIEAMFIIVATTIFGIGAQLASIRIMVELGAFVMLIVSGVLLF
ncbi:hypothetical protein [Lentibacillus sp. Marseille-P4043]|uniref:hypothetical protein n=1 Tax=Lentibacillus sp. Marseille-P4043 TaxID=2040293 RepID=UPI00131A5453|nr:hypothetical protein [Lentibacillus sp. Marseille-P4043]